MRKIQEFLLQLTVFLIPTNLAYHFYTNEAFIHGRLIDYLLPKLYLSDIPLLGVILIYLLNSYKNKCYINIIKYKYSSALIFYLVLRSLFTSSPLASLWYVFKIIEMVVFAVCLLTTYTRTQLYQLCKTPLLLSLGLQSIVGLYQYINQYSFFGYYFLGEPNLASVGLAKDSWLGTVKTLPYGTTAHPNVLAGFIICALWLLSTAQSMPKKLLRIQNSPIPYPKLIISFTVISLSILALILTQSQTALIASIALLVIALHKSSASSKHFKVTFKRIIFGTLIMSVIFILSAYHLKPFGDLPSISTRYELILQAFSTIQQHYFLGVGPNLFTTTLSQEPLPGQKILFIQPVHNILVLSLAEIGLIGFLLILPALASLKHLLNKAIYSSPEIIQSGLLIGILGGFDHYLLTLQTGQLLLVLILVTTAQFFKPTSKVSKS